MKNKRGRANLMSDHPLEIQCYKGFGNQERFFIKGRVLENENLSKTETDSKLKILWNNFKRIESDEIPEAELKLILDSYAYEMTTDDEGYFELEASWIKENNSDSIETGNIQLLNPKVQNLELWNSVEIFKPSPRAAFGVISDMDDTVLQTHMTSTMMLKMLYVSFLKGAHARLPMEGMVELLNKLSRGKKDSAKNPIFYVSNSPWNLYDVLSDFLKLQKLPSGPLLLRDFGVEMLFKRKSKVPHKLATIRRILQFYPNLPFICLGDTASNDADFYLDLSKEFDGQIKAIIIRETKVNSNSRRIRKLNDSYGHDNFHVVSSSKEMLPILKTLNLIR